MQTFSVLVDDTPGVVNRVSSVLRRRGLNILSLTVAETHIPSVSRMTLVVDTDERGARFVVTSVAKLEDVHRIDTLTHVSTIARDLALIRVAAVGDDRPVVMRLLEDVAARLVDVRPEWLVAELTGTVAAIDALLVSLRPFGVLEISRSGCVALAGDP